MKVRSMRIPDDIDSAIQYVSKWEKIENTQSLRKLARIGFEFYIAKKYYEGSITLRQASALLNLTISETMDVFAEMGVKGNIRTSVVMDSVNSYAPVD